MGKSFILGNGLSGLIWGYYHPTYEIIAPVQSGKLGGLTSMYLTWIHDSWETRKLISDLGWKNPAQYSKRSNVGYLIDGWVSDRLTDRANQELIQKKMTSWNQPICIEAMEGKLSMTSQVGVNYMNTLDIDSSLLVKRLQQACKVTHGYAVSITPAFLGISNEPFSPTFRISYQKYGHIISTIPAPFFWKAYNKPQEFKYLPITNIIVSNKPKEFDGNYEMIYYGSEFAFSRISHLMGKYALEFTGVLPRETFEKMYPDLKIEDYFVVPQGRIFQRENHASPQSNIIFSGRFSSWKHAVTTETVVHQALEFNNAA